MIASKDKKRFRTIGHQLHPIVTVGGNGLSDSVLTELERAINDHELIKVKIVGDKEEREEVMPQLIEKTGAELVQLTGGVALVYRKNNKPNPKLSNLVRFSS